MLALAVGAMTVAGAGAGAIAAGQSDDATAQALQKAATPTEVAPDGMPAFEGQGGRHGGPGPRAAIMAPVADLVKLDEPALRKRLHVGETLVEVAADQGVSEADLVAGIAAALKAARPADAPERTDAEITEMATRIAEGSGPCAGGEGGPGGGPGPGAVFDAPGGDSETPGQTAPAVSAAPTPAPATPSV